MFWLVFQQVLVLWLVLTGTNVCVLIGVLTGVLLGTNVCFLTAILSGTNVFVLTGVHTVNTSLQTGVPTSTTSVLTGVPWGTSVCVQPGVPTGTNVSVREPQWSSPSSLLQNQHLQRSRLTYVSPAQQFRSNNTFSFLIVNTLNDSRLDTKTPAQWPLVNIFEAVLKEFHFK